MKKIVTVKGTDRKNGGFDTWSGNWDFEDGTVVEHIRVNNFKRQQISHNVFFNTYHVKHIAFTYHDTTYFDVTYTYDNIEYRDIMSIDDMRRQLENAELIN